MDKKFMIKGNYAGIINYIFQTILVTYLILLLLEQIWQGFVSVYLNLNYLLIAVIIVGILDVFSLHEDKKNERTKKSKWYDYLFIVILGILGFVIILFKTKDSLDLWLSSLISGIAGILIILLSILILSEDESKDESQNQRKKFHLSKRTWIMISLSIIMILLAISFLITIFTSIEFLSSLRITFGSIFVLFIPGFVLTFVFFPLKNEKEKIDLLERIALSFALSIAVVPLAVFYFNLIGVKINVINSSLIILGIIFIGFILIYLRHKKIWNKNKLSDY